MRYAVKRGISFLLIMLIVFTTIFSNTSVSAFAEEFGKNKISELFSEEEVEILNADTDAESIAITKALVDTDELYSVDKLNETIKTIISDSELDGDNSDVNGDAQILSSGGNGKTACYIDFSSSINHINALDTSLNYMVDCGEISSWDRAYMIDYYSLIERGYHWFVNGSPVFKPELSVDKYSFIVVRIDDYKENRFGGGYYGNEFYYNGLVMNDISKYIQNGGSCIFITSGDGIGTSSGYPSLPGGVVVANDSYSDEEYNFGDVRAVNSRSPIITGGRYATPVDVGCFYDRFAHIDKKTLVSGTDIVAENSVSGDPKLVVYPYGKGTTIVSTVVPFENYGGTFFFQGMLNMLRYALDVSATSVSVPVSSASGTTVTEITDASISKVIDKLPDILINMGDITGPTVDIWGYKIPLIPLGKTKLSAKIGGFSPAIETDTDSKTIKIIIGLSDDRKANIGTGESYLKEYNDIKQLYNYVTGDDLTKLGKNTWNQYQKLRSKMDKSTIGKDSSIVLKATAKVVGFFEISYETGELIPKSCGVMVMGSVGGSYTWQPSIYYVTTGLTGQADIGVTVGFDSTKGALSPYLSSLNTNASLALNVAAGMGVKKGISVYIEGGATGTIGLEITQNLSGSSGCMYATEKVYIKGKVGPYEKTFCEKTYPEKGKARLIIWSSDGTKKQSQFEFSDIKELADSINNSFSKAPYVSIPRNYLSVGESESIQSVSEYEFILSSVYPYAGQTLVSLNDNERLLIWVGDKGNKADNDRSTILYSRYVDGEWSAVSSVYESGTYMDAPVVCQAGGHTYVAWIQASRIFGTEGTPEEILKSCDIYVSEYVDGVFTEPVCVSGGEDGVFESSVTIGASDNGNLSVMWIEKDGDILGAEEPSTVKLNQRIDGVWAGESTIYETDASINSLFIEQTDENAKLFLTLNDENEVVSLSGSDEDDSADRVSLYQIVNSELSLINESVRAVELHDGTLYYATEDTLHSYAVSTDTDSELALISGISDFRIIDNGNSSAILALYNNGLKNEIFSASLDDISESGMLMWEQFTNFGEYIRDYSAIMLSNGEIKAAINQVDVLYNEELETEYYDNSSNICITGMQDFADLNVDYLTYNSEDIVPGESTNMYFSVTNIGNIAENGFTAVLTDEAGEVLATRNYSEDIASGSTEEFEIEYILPHDLHLHNVSLSISSDNDANNDNNNASTEIGLADISVGNGFIEATGYDSGIYGCVVKNEGYSDAENVILNVYSDAEHLDRISTFEFGNLAAGTSESCEFELPIDLVRVWKYGTMNALYFEVVCSSSESNIVNNEDKLVYDSLLGNKVLITAHDEDVVTSKLVDMEAYEFPSDFTNIEKEGYFFGGWYIDENFETKYDTESVPDRDIEIYARWLDTPVIEGESPSYSTAVISWEKIPGADLYVVERYDEDLQDYRTIYSGADASFTDTDLYTRVEYSYRVSMLRTASDGEERRSKYALTAVTPVLDAVSESAAVCTSYNSTEITWSAVEGATGYNIYRYDETAKEYLLIASTEENLSYADTNLLFDTTYIYSVCARRDMDRHVAYSEMSEPVKVKTVLQKVTGVTGTISSDASIRLEWDAVAGADGYYVYKLEPGSDELVFVKTLKTNKSTYTTVKSLVAGNEYGFVVKAYRMSGESRRNGELSDRFDMLLLPTTTITTAKSVDYSTIEAVWEPSNVGTGYELLACTTRTGEYDTVATIEGLENTSYMLTGLKTGSTYYLKVRVVNGDSKGALSGSKYCKVVLNTPELTVEPDVTSATLTWNRIDGATGYMVAKYDSETGIYTTVKGISGGDNTTYTIKGLTLGEKYSYSVRAALKDENGKTFYSGYAKIKSVTMRMKAPETITFEQTAEHNIKLTWNKCKEATGYYVKIKEFGQSDYTVAKRLDSGDLTEYELTNLEIGKTYSAVISSICETDGKKYYSSNSSPVEFVVNVGKVTEVSAVNTENGNVLLAWSPVSEADGYIVYRSHFEDAGFEAIGTIEGEDASAYIDENIAYSEIYYYKVCAYVATDSILCGALSDVLFFCPVEKIHNLSVSSYESVALIVSWGSVIAENVTILRSVNEAGPYEVIATVDANDSQYYDYDLTIGETYYYKVFASTMGCDGLISEYASGAVTLGVPDIAIKNTSINSVEIEWNYVTGAQGYEIYRLSGDEYALIKNISNSDTLNWIDTDCAPNSEYSYRVRAYSYVGESVIYSDLSEIVSTVTVMGKVQNFRAEVEGSTIKFSWEPLYAANGYCIYELVNGEYTLLAEIDNSVGYFEYEAESKTTRHFAIVVYTNVGGTRYFSDYSDSIEVSFEIVVECDKSGYPESAHPYANNTSKTWTYTHRGATKLVVTFSEDTEFENGYDFLYIYDGNNNQIGKYSGKELAGTTITIDGDTFSLKLTSDGSVTRNGFSIDSILAYEAPDPEIVSIDIVMPPSKLIYMVGDEIDLSGLTIELFFDNGEMNWIDDVSLDHVIYDFSQPGTQTVTIIYGTLTTTFEVTVFSIATDTVPVDIDPSVYPYPESAHPYADDAHEHWNFEYAGAVQIVLYFSTETMMEEGCDYLRIYDGSHNLIGEFTGYSLSGACIPVSGEAVYLEFVSDGSVNDYGFSIDRIVARVTEGQSGDEDNDGYSIDIDSTGGIIQGNSSSEENESEPSEIEQTAGEGTINESINPESGEEEIIVDVWWSIDEASMVNNKD